ncbi:MAG: Mur ligase family protein, partial [Bacteroidota bacterium]
MKTLGALIAPLKATGLLSRSGARLDNDVSIDHLSQDSRKITRNGLCVAVRGNIADGHMFIDKAVNNGAVAIVCEEVPGNAHERFAGTYFVRVKDSRHALAVLARNFYDLPDQELQVFGVTGTNGKTTTSALIHHMLTKLGVGAGLIGTIEERIGEKAVPATLTTPDPVHIHGLFRLMREENCSHAVMEVSSHA